MSIWTRLKTANKVSDWGKIGVLVLSFILALMIPILSLFIGIYLCMSRYYDYKEKKLEYNFKKELYRKYANK